MVHASSPSSAETASQLRNLLKETSKKNKSLDDRTDAARLDQLRRVFAQLAQSGDLSFPPVTTSTISETRQKWHAFLHTSHETFVRQLVRRVQAGKRTALRTLQGVVATTPQTVGNSNHHIVSPRLVRAWVTALMQAQDDSLLLTEQSVQHLVQSECLALYRDVQYSCMGAVTHAATTLYQQRDDETCQQRAARLVQLLMMIPVATKQSELTAASFLFAPPTENTGIKEKQQQHDEGHADDSENEEEEDSESDDDDDSGSSRKSDSEEEEETAAKATKKQPATKQWSFTQIRAHRRAWSKAWLAVLRLPLPPSTLKMALRFAATSVLPNVARPLRFADFFLSAYETSAATTTSVVPVLALEGLFLLMTVHGLEYPDFYKQLYALVTPSLLHVKYRTKFFLLLDKCLSRNDMLPAHVVAAFLKRLLRACLSAPPAGTLFCLALVSNLLRKHKETSSLIHRNRDALEDGFDATTNDPEQANALASSLWELSVLERHYLPAVATLAQSIGSEAELAAPLHNLSNDDATFLGHSYHSLLEQERKRKTKSTPVTFAAPTTLFSDQDVFAGMLKRPRLET